MATFFPIAIGSIPYIFLPEYRKRTQPLLGYRGAFLCSPSTAQRMGIFTRYLSYRLVFSQIPMLNQPFFENIFYLLRE